MIIDTVPNYLYRFEFYINYDKKTWQEIKNEKGCDKIINLAYYDMAAYLKATTQQAVLDSIACDFILNGKALKPLKYHEFGLCINEKGELSMATPQGQTNYCMGLPPQYVDGLKYCVNSFVAKNGCTHIGFLADGSPVLALESKDNGMTNDEINAAMLKYGCVTILRYDGSWSSQGDFGNGKTCKPSQTRIVQCYLLAYVRKSEQKEDEAATEQTIINKSLTWNGTLTKRKLTTLTVYHHACGYGSVEDIHAYHKALGWLGIAYHFYVRMDGSIYQGRPIDTAGGHTLNYNYCAIGVCAEGNFENVDEMPAVQRESLKWLSAYIKTLYPTSIDKRHSELNQTACPGTNYPFAYIVGSSSQIPTTANDVVVAAGSGIALFQAWLNTFYSSGLTADGIYGAKTKAAAVKAYQSFLNSAYKAKLSADGAFGAKTKAAVRTLQRGCKGDDVTILQGLLYCAGLDPSGLDGVFGAGTYSALVTYQSNKNLDADGIAGKQTIASLMG